MGIAYQNRYIDNALLTWDCLSNRCIDNALLTCGLLIKIGVSIMRY